jgi:hypothetical protein
MGAANKIGLLEVYLVADRSKEVNLAERASLLLVNSQTEGQFFNNSIFQFSFKSKIPETP